MRACKLVSDQGLRYTVGTKKPDDVGASRAMVRHRQPFEGSTQ